MVGCIGRSFGFYFWVLCSVALVVSELVLLEGFGGFVIV